MTFLCNQIYIFCQFKEHSVRFFKKESLGVPGWLVSWASDS